MISESACQLMCGASQFANDGIFDEIEYFKSNKKTFEDCHACHRGAARSKEAKTGK